MNATLEFIGQIRTPYKRLEDCPRNIDPAGPLCELVLNNETKDGASGLVPGQKILVLYWFDAADRKTCQLESRKKGKRTGVFALRSPQRPNPIGAAVVTIEDIKNNCIFVKGLDCLDGTPLLDIKPAILDEQTQSEFR
jgi:tRNA-Thr(GGU) m(6)t(6)A37 methyltransferase TsaA